MERMLVLVKITLIGNYNVEIADLKLSFSPDQREKTISEEEFDNSFDLKRVLQYFKIEKGNEIKEEVVRTVVEPEKQVEVHEIPVKETEHEVIDATNKSLSDSSIKAKEDFEKKLDEQVIDATDKSLSDSFIKAKEDSEKKLDEQVIDTTNAFKEQVEVKEEVKQEEVITKNQEQEVVTEAHEKVIAESQEEETAEAVDDKPFTSKKKLGRPKKNK